MRKFYAKAKDMERGTAETTRKFNLFRELGPEKFYELYPDDKPAGYQPPAAREPARPEIPANIGAMVVQGGPYNGQTLNEVYTQDPAYATLLQNQYLDGQREKVTTAKQRHEALKSESEQEIASFSEYLATDLFGKKPGELSKDQETQLVQKIQATLDWMAQTKRGAGIIGDAYFLMNQEYMLKTAHEKGGKAALEALQKPPIASVDTAGGKSVVSTDFESMTRDQLAAKIEGMTDAQAAKFYRDAPAGLKAKHPDLPWD